MLRSVDVIANNIANSSTTGFKREGIEFDTYLTGQSQKSTSYVYDRATYRDTTPGVISKTGNPLDLAIQGQGYFQIQTPSGTQYTRDGAFRLDNQGQIVTSNGMPVLSDGGAPVVIPDESSDITISGDGFITAQVGTSTSRAQLGKLGIVKFDDDKKVMPSGAGFLTTTQTPTPAAPNAGNNILVQGAIEESNVKPVVEMTDLIRIQRAYEQATNMVTNENTRLSDAYDKLSQTT